MKRQRENEDVYWLVFALVFAAAGLTGISPFNWEILIIMEGAAGIGAYKFLDVRAKIRTQRGSRNVQAEQKGRGNTQTSLSNPKNSSVFNVRGDLNLGGAANPTPEISTPSQRLDPSGQEWIWQGHIQYSRYEYSDMRLKKGDVVEGEAKSNTAFSIQIMSAEEFEYFRETYAEGYYEADDDEEESYEVDWQTPKTKNHRIHWESPASGDFVIAIVDEEEETDQEVEVNATVKITRKVGRK